MGFTIARKIFLATVFILFIGSLSTLIIYNGLQTVDRELHQIIKTEEPTSAAAYEMEINIVGIGLGVMEYLNTGDPQTRARVEDDRSDFQNFKAQYDRLSLSEKEKEFGEKLSGLYSEYNALADVLMDKRDRGEQVFDTPEFKRFVILRQEIDNVLDDEIQSAVENELAASDKRAEAVSHQTLLVTLVSLPTFILLGVGAGWLLIRLIRGPLDELIKGIEKVENGDLSYRLPEISNDEFGELAKHFNRMVAQLEQTTVSKPRLLEASARLSNEINERLQIEKSLLKSEERYHRLIEALPETVFVIRNNKIVFINQAGLQLFGAGSEEEIIGKSPFYLFHPSYHEQIREYVRQLRKSNCEVSLVEEKIVRLDGKTIDVEIVTSPFEDEGGKAILVILRDISARKNAEEALTESEEKLRQAQKLEAIGRLAGGIAHDFNNMLGVIIGYSDLILSRYAEQTDLRNKVEEIHRAAQRSADLTQQLLAFSRKQILQPKILDLNKLVTDSSKMLGRLIGENIELVTALRPSIGRINADPSQIEQILINLVLNARDAMPKGGKITIETANAELDERYANMHITVKPGKYVMLAVTDTGEGMDSETQRRIFEPFFSTKEFGKGTGLGLSTVYGIVKQSGGNIWVYSELGKGTTFKIYLLRVEETAEQIEILQADQTVLTGTETILLVEDEEMLRKLTRAVLAEQGFEVLETGSPEEALQITRGYKGQIDLLLTDVVMPQMNGRELAEKIKLLRPQVRVLFTSGYTDDTIAHYGVLDKDVILLVKPFTAEALVRKVREVLDAPAEEK